MIFPFECLFMEDFPAMFDWRGLPEQLPTKLGAVTGILKQLLLG